MPAARNDCTGRPSRSMPATGVPVGDGPVTRVAGAPNGTAPGMLFGGPGGPAPRPAGPLDIARRGRLGFRARRPPMGEEAARSPPTGEASGLLGGLPQAAGMKAPKPL